MGQSTKKKERPWKAKQVSPLLLMVSSTVVVTPLRADFYSSFPKAGREMVFIALLFENFRLPFDFIALWRAYSTYALALSQVWMGCSGNLGVNTARLMASKPLIHGSAPAWAFDIFDALSDNPLPCLRLSERNVTWSSVERWIDLPLCNQLRYVAVLRRPVARSAHGTKVVGWLQGKSLEIWIGTKK